MEIPVVAGGKYNGSLMYLNPTSITIEVVFDFLRKLKLQLSKTELIFLELYFDFAVPEWPLTLFGIKNPS